MLLFLLTRSCRRDPLAFTQQAAVGAKAAGNSSNYSFFWWRFKALLHRSGTLPMIGPVSLGSSRRSLYEPDWQGAARTPLDHGPIRRNHRPDAARSIRLGWCVASGVSLAATGEGDARCRSDSCPMSTTACETQANVAGTHMLD